MIGEKEAAEKQRLYQGNRTHFLPGVFENCSVLGSLRLPGWLLNVADGLEHVRCRLQAHPGEPPFACERGSYVRPPGNGVLPCKQCLLGFKQLAMGDFPAKMPEDASRSG